MAELYPFLLLTVSGFQKERKHNTCSQINSVAISYLWRSQWVDRRISGRDCWTRIAVRFFITGSRRNQYLECYMLSDCLLALVAEVRSLPSWSESTAVAAVWKKVLRVRTCKNSGGTVCQTRCKNRKNPCFARKRRRIHRREKAHRKEQKHSFC